MTGLLVRNAELDGRRCDVRVRGGVIAEVGITLRADGEEVVDAGGGALLPGLHDHHLHLFALAAALDSVDCSPSAVGDAVGFADALRRAAAAGPVRAVGYFESIAGSLDRDVLDTVVPDVPVRVQHRSGAAWFLNSAALVATGLAESTDPAVDRDAAGRPTGRLSRGDHLLRRDGTLPDLDVVGRLLASYGVTGVTDATPRLDATQVQALRAVPQRTVALGAPLADPAAAGVPWKVLVDEVPGLDPGRLLDEVREAHAAGRPVALHCTSRTETVLAVSALLQCGVVAGDRLEHAGVLPPDLDAELAATGVTVVTQPHFMTERGDAYLVDVEPDDHELLYRCGTLLDAGVPVAAGTDAPYGAADPWASMAAAMSRATLRGTVIGPQERIDARRALDLFLGDPLAPGGPPRRLVPGTPADLCLLRVPLVEALRDPRAELVAATVVAGEVVHPG